MRQAMKLNLSKEWLTKRAERDDKADVSAGVFSMDMFKSNQHKQKIALTNPPCEEDTRLAFGKLINLWRRKKGLRMEQLAEKANIDLAELIEIERNIHCTPEPRTVYQLARTLGLSNERMLQLSGNVIARDHTLGQEAVRFAARSESVEKLNKDEQRALEEFVKFLSEK
jgi:HTH-type transcriptional regulator, competence development regulator